MPRGLQLDIIQILILGGLRNPKLVLSQIYVFLRGSKHNFPLFLLTISRSNASLATHSEFQGVFRVQYLSLNSPIILSSSLTTHCPRKVDNIGIKMCVNKLAMSSNKIYDHRHDCIRMLGNLQNPSIKQYQGNVLFHFNIRFN